MSIELQRRSITGSALDLSALSEEDRKRALELSAYFTIPTMETAHMTLAWYSAMNLANRNKQFSTALSFANQLIERGTNPKFKGNVCYSKPSSRWTADHFQARKVKQACERNPSDAVEIEFDQFAEFEICAASYTPIYNGSPSVSCAYCGSKYQSKYKGTVCKICEVCQLGAPSSGLKLYV